MLSSETTVESLPEETHLHSTTLLLHSQLVPEPRRICDPADALSDLLVAGVRAAVVAPEKELPRWFSWRWYLAPGAVDDLVAAGRLRRLPGGLMALGPLPGLEGG